MWRGIFLPELTSSVDSLTMSTQPPCAIACINVCVHINNPKHWQPHLCFDIWNTLIGMGSAALAVPYPDKATQISCKGKEMPQKKKISNQQKAHLPLIRYFSRSPDLSGWPSTTRPIGRAARMAWKTNHPRKMSVASMSTNIVMLLGSLGSSMTVHLSWKPFVPPTPFISLLME